MPRALPLPLREQLVELRQRGLSLAEVARQLAVPYRSVWRLWHRYAQRGSAGLAPDYAHCGPQGCQFPAPLKQAALTLKQAHPRWGAGLIRLQLAEQFPGEPLPGVRTLQEWFQQAGLSVRRAQPPPTNRQRARQPHEVWQIDAKEKMRLADGSGTCVLTVTDEATGALLGATPFPPLLLEPGPRAAGATGAAVGLRDLGTAPADPR
jgi:transposase